MRMSSTMNCFFARMLRLRTGTSLSLRIFRQMTYRNRLPL